MGRRSACVAVLVFVFSVIMPWTARAGSVWDPNDLQQRLDIRWVGVAIQADGRVRVTLTFHDPVKTWQFKDRLVQVQFGPSRGAPYVEENFFLTRTHRLKAVTCFGGSGCLDGVRVLRPNPRSIRARFTFPNAYDPADWLFRGLTTAQPQGRILDRTRWSSVG